MAKPVPPLSLIQYFDVPDDYRSGFCWMCGYSADALFLNQAIERFTREIPAPNYMSPERRKQLQRWGRRTFPVIIEKFAGTDVDFSKTMSNIEYALRPDDTRR